MKHIREHIIFKLFWLAMAINILNSSVDMSDLQPQEVPEDLAYNDMESIVEILLEQILQIENAIAEFDDCDLDQTQALTLNKGLDFFCLPSFTHRLAPKKSNITDLPVLFGRYVAHYAPQTYPEITPPPPKA